jgi:hypothetical protein
MFTVGSSRNCVVDQQIVACRAQGTSYGRYSMVDSVHFISIRFDRQHGLLDLCLSMLSGIYALPNIEIQVI